MLVDPATPRIRFGALFFDPSEHADGGRRCPVFFVVPEVPKDASQLDLSDAALGVITNMP